VRVVDKCNHSEQHRARRPSRDSCKPNSKRWKKARTGTVRIPKKAKRIMTGGIPQ
jgi:hypothetical protein